MADWEIIEEGKVTGATVGDITFSAIPQTYQHLEFTFSLRIENTNYTNIYININGDTTSTYSRCGWASTQTASHVPFRLTEWSATASAGMVGYAAGSNYSTGAFSALNVIIPNYTNTDDYKIVLSRGAQGAEDYTDGYTSAMGTGWASTAAVTSVAFMPPSWVGTPYWTAGSSYMLAGYKG